MSYEKCEYKHGAIIKINLRNFITFTQVELNPGPNLNLIIGANGTGKSSILCAICLGLAGKPSVLGRSDNVGGFIKHGSTEASIEIELCNSQGDNWIIERIIKEHSSVWFINRKSVISKTVDALVSSLNVQMNNLCQFLPQDKVADFAKMTNQQLLISTENAINIEIYKQHCSLIESSNGVEKQNLKMISLEESLKQKSERYERVKLSEQGYKERELLIQIVKLLTKKKYVMVFKETFEDYEVEKKNFEEKVTALKTFQKEIIPMEKTLKENIEKSEQLLEKSKIHISKYDMNYNKYRSVDQKMNDCTSEVIDIQKELEIQKEGIEVEKTKMKNQQDIIEHMKNDIPDEKEEKNFDEKINKLKDEITVISDEVNQIKLKCTVLGNDLVDKNAMLASQQRQLEDLQSVQKQKMSMLKSSDINTFKAYEWLQENRHKFTHEVCGPIMIEINAIDKSFSKYIENSIAFRDLKAFVFEDRNDMILFNRLMSKQNLKCNSVIPPPSGEFTPSIPLARLRNFGFTHYLNDTFTCPKLVMTFLCSNCLVHITPLGSDMIERNIEDIKNQFPSLTNFYSPNFSFSLSRSIYGNRESITRTLQISSSKYLSCAADPKGIKLYQQKIMSLDLEKRQIQVDHDQLNEQHEKLQDTCISLRQEKKKLEISKAQRSNHLSKLALKEKSLANFIKNMTNIEEIEKAASRKLFKLIERKTTIMKELPLLLKAMYEGAQKNVLYCISADFIKLQNKDLFSQVENFRNRIAIAEKNINEHKLKIQELKSELKVMKNKMKSQKYEEQELLDIYPDELPQTIGEIQSLIVDKQARVECAVDYDENVIQESRQLCKQINEIQEEIAGLRENFSNASENLSEMHDNWLNPMQRLLYDINIRFSKFFEDMGNKGEIFLKTPENKGDYANYGIGISVKFRSSDPMCELSSHRQSGGERSVSTVLYMMALQQLSSCPFRCVDEINQGMDPSNERKVFNLISHCSSGSELSSQYFLLTPKLLPSLDYSRQTTILMVYNGRGLKIKDENFKLHKLMQADHQRKLDKESANNNHKKRKKKKCNL